MGKRKMRTHEEDDDTPDPWYVKTCPRSPHRSKDAYIRERLRYRKPRIDQHIEDVLWKTRVENATMEPRNFENGEKGTMRSLSECASNHIVDVLIDEATNEGGLGTNNDEARDAWTAPARAHAQRCLENQAPANHWDTIVRAIRNTEPDRLNAGAIRHEIGNNNSKGLTMRRLAELAHKGAEFARKLGRCEPWAAREACWNFPEEILDEDPGKWAIRAVQQYGNTLNPSHRVSEKQAQDELKHWRWPTMRPPIGIIVRNIGQMPPLQSDNAWANALNTILGGKLREHALSIKQIRESEENAARKTIGKVAEAARKNVHTSNNEEASKIIRRCQKVWGNSDGLEGNGLIGEPKLEAVQQKRGKMMVWVFEIDGPETLIAGCKFSGRKIEEVLKRYDTSRIALAMSIEEPRGNGKLFERETGSRHRQMKDKETLHKIERWRSLSPG